MPEAEKKILVAPVTVWVLYSLDQKIETLQKTVDNNFASALAPTTNDTQRSLYLQIMKVDNDLLKQKKGEKERIQKIHDQMLIQLSNFVATNTTYSICCPVPPKNCACSEARPLDLYVDFPEYNVVFDPHSPVPVVTRATLPTSMFLDVCQDLVDYSKNTQLGALKLPATYLFEGRTREYTPTSISFGGEVYPL